MTELVLDTSTAAYRHLMTDPLFTSLLNNVVIGRDVDPTVVGNDLFYQDWVFQSFDSEGSTYRDVEGTGLAEVVMFNRDDWASNNHNTARFPILTVMIYADSSRNADQSIAVRDAVRRCTTVADAVDLVFHDAGNRTHAWDEMRITSCVRRGGLSITDVPTKEGVVRGTLRYEVSR